MGQEQTELHETGRERTVGSECESVTRTEAEPLEKATRVDTDRQRAAPAVRLGGEEDSSLG